MTTIEDRLNRGEPRWWKPDTGAQLIGQVLELEQRSGKYGPYLVAIVETADNVEFAVPCPTVLERQFIEKKVAVGDSVGIEYLGIKPRLDGSGNYGAYRLVCDHAAQPAPAARPKSPGGDDPLFDDDDPSKACTRSTRLRLEIIQTQPNSRSSRGCSRARSSSVRPTT